jgi:hypothetical protein
MWSKTKVTRKHGINYDREVYTNYITGTSVRNSILLLKKTELENTFFIFQIYGRHFCFKDAVLQKRKKRIFKPKNMKQKELKKKI